MDDIYDDIPYDFDPEETSYSEYEDRMLKIIENKLLDVKDLNSNEWLKLNNACYEMMQAYKFLINASDKIGSASRAIKYSKEVLEYSEQYRHLLDDRILKDITNIAWSILKKYRVEL